MTPASSDGSQKTPEQRSPEQLRQEIERTRAQLGDTVEALAARTDVKARAKDRIAAVKDGATHKKEELVSRSKEVTPESAGARGKRIATTIQSNPVPFTAGGALAAGLLIGWLIGRKSR